MSQTLSNQFLQIPGNDQVPGQIMEVVGDYNNVGVLPFPARALIIGGMTSAGTGAANTILNVFAPQQGAQYGGAGSQIDQMVQAFFATQPTMPLDIVMVPDAGGSAAAAGTSVISGSWTVAWTYALLIAGVRVAVGLLPSDTPTTAQAAMVAAIAATQPALPVSATASTGTLTVTALNKGLAGNDLQLALSTQPSDALPAGATVAITGMAAGATNPTISAALNAINGVWYTDIAIAWQDATNTSLLTALLATRFGALVNQDGVGYTTFTGSFAQQLAKAAAANSQYLVAFPVTAPQSPPWAISASLMGVCATRTLADPARQIRNFTLPGIVGPTPPNQLTPGAAGEQQQAVTNGLTIYNVQQNGTVVLERVVTTYLTTTAGLPDTLWMDLMAIKVATRIRWDWDTYFGLTYPNAKLANDGTLAAEYDSSIVTPLRAKGSWIARTQLYEQNGWIENAANLGKQAVFQRNASNRNRLDYTAPINRIGNMMILAGQLQVQA